MERLGICTLLHFLVDGLCLCCLYLMAASCSTASLVGVFLLYNVLAFLTQPLSGLCVDRLREPHWMLLGSVMLLTLAVGVASAVVFVVSLHTSRLLILLVATMLGLGNSLFHVWGGRQVALTTANDMRALGLFVSTGAMGLAVGAVFCSWPLLYMFLLSLCLLAAVYVQRDGRLSAKTDDNRAKGGFGLGVVVLAVLALMAFVMLRSFVGEAFSANIPKQPKSMLLLIGAVAMLGKMAGGWVARQFGIIKTLLTVAVVVALCALLRDESEAVLLTGLFAVNCTMPVTLYLANVVLKGHEGLAFGLLAAALIPGYLLAYL